MKMKKNIMLFKWFLKFFLLPPRDEYNVHDYVRDSFSPEFLSAEELDEKERILRDTPGPAGIKYAFYVGYKVNGTAGALAAMGAILLPAVALAAALIAGMKAGFGTEDSTVKNIFTVMFEGAFATTLGLIAAHMYKTVYFNRVNKGSLTVIIPSALVFLFLPEVLFTAGIIEKKYIPSLYCFAGIIIFGILLGFIYDKIHKIMLKMAADPKRQPDPYSKKAVRARDRKLREEEEEMRRK